MCTYLCVCHDCVGSGVLLPFKGDAIEKMIRVLLKLWDKQQPLFFFFFISTYVVTHHKVGRECLWTQNNKERTCSEENIFDLNNKHVHNEFMLEKIFKPTTQSFFLLNLFLQQVFS